MPLKQHPTNPDMVIYKKTEYGNISVGKEWIGLSDKVKLHFVKYAPEWTTLELIEAVETELKEKNHGNG